MKYKHLEIGDILELAGHSAVVIAIQERHPLDPRFIMIIWWLIDSNRVSVDMLGPEVELMPGSTVRQDRLATWGRATRMMCQ
jgi:hypothetical protein